MQNKVNLKLKQNTQWSILYPFFTDICLLIFLNYLRTFWVEERFLRKTEFGMSYSC